MSDDKHPAKHPFLAGNFAPVRKQLLQEPCEIEGTVPDELAGGQFVRNGSNPLPYRDSGLDMHWFDGHGMLSAVYFRPIKDGNESSIEALYSNQYILTDIFLAESKSQDLSMPILPSIATLINPKSSLITIIIAVLRTVWAVVYTWIDRASKPIKRISVVNTAVVSHNGRILATCESGPLMRVSLPDLKTVGWFDGYSAEGEAKGTKNTVPCTGYSGKGLLGFFQEWTTGHPHIDPVTGEMMLFHSTFFRPFVRYSVLARQSKKAGFESSIFGQPVPGMPSPKMMHDFGVSRQHTVIIDMPLTLNPFDLAYGKSVTAFSSNGKTRFGVFPRHKPQEVQWFSTEACCIFHTVNTWDEVTKTDTLHTTVNMLACRMTGPSMVYTAGNLPVPSEQAHPKDEILLYYYQFAVDGNQRRITQQWALSAVLMEFPHVPKHLAMSATQFTYSCSMAQGHGAEGSGGAMKIGSLVKINVQKLIARGLANPPTPVTGCVDNRSIEEVAASDDPDDPIQLFLMPEGVYAQECAFVPRKGGKSEDDGWLLTYVFDESQFDADGDAPEDSRSELWIIDAVSMKDVVGRIRLPQRVPYGLHGNWFTSDDIAQQRPVEQFQES
ncbi:Carotenoid 9,10(9',10')-cleavage dioxygenase 1-like protein [Cladobotryum mycophilum]|uniref:Carotenoid 9,10(9',10')-cleavage dioxygenase 1-like protein n=1 Tax=Cladobotryum mycophilum TaxID=491253 RepID=A0ABR0SX79_9HYPO